MPGSKILWRRLEVLKNGEYSERLSILDILIQVNISNSPFVYGNYCLNINHMEHCARKWHRPLPAVRRCTQRGGSMSEVRVSQEEVTVTLCG